MKCGLRSQAAGVNSRPFSDIEAIIQKNFMDVQQELPGRDKEGWKSSRYTQQAFERDLESLEIRAP